MLNLGNVFTDVNSTLTGLIGKYTGLRFIGLDEDNNNAYKYLSSVITKGFYYRANRVPETGQVTELLRIVPEDDQIEQIIKDCDIIELIRPDGEFVRFRVTAKKEAAPPSYQWVLSIEPNRNDRRVIV